MGDTETSKQIKGHFKITNIHEAILNQSTINNPLPFISLRDASKKVMLNNQKL